MIPIEKPRSFHIKKWACIAVCIIGMLILISYAVLIATDKMPNTEETNEMDSDTKRQDIFNKVMDMVFHGLGIIGAMTENHATTLTFLILTLITKYIAISEAIENYYFWPYAAWSIVVSIVGGMFYRDLRKLRLLKLVLDSKCPHCVHCNPNLGYVPPVLTPAGGQAATYPANYPQQFDSA